MSRFLELKNTKPLASGQMRHVFRHPNEPDLLIKVIRPDAIDQRWGSGVPWYKMNRRYRQYISFIREIEEYIAAYAKHDRSLPFVQTVVGLAETDYGLGLVLKAAMDDEGNLAPPLTKLLNRDLFDEEASAALENFFAEILATDLVVADLHPGNLVYASDGKGGRHFVMIDGLGVSTIIPFKSFSKTLNRRSKEKRIQRLRDRVTTKLESNRAKKAAEN